MFGSSPSLCIVTAAKALSPFQGTRSAATEGVAVVSQLYIRPSSPFASLGYFSRREKNVWLAVGFSPLARQSRSIPPKWGDGACLLLDGEGFFGGDTFLAGHGALAR
jgi:hypothetical protein